jgi:RNA polymerase sigma-70 factor (ECF subfamily)
MCFRRTAASGYEKSRWSGDAIDHRAGRSSRRTEIQGRDMGEDTPENVTQLLHDSSLGDEGATNALVPLVYDELRRIARSYMRRERQGHTLQTTALVHEAYLRLVGQDVNWANRSQFFGIAAQMMRRILVDQAKGHFRAKRGGGAIQVTLDGPALMVAQSDDEVLALDEALAKLEKVDRQRARIVELRFFGGLSNEEASKVLDISTATIQRQWAGARAWLFHELKRKE